MNSPKFNWKIIPAGLLIIALLAVIAYVAFVFLTYSRIEDNVELEVQGKAEEAARTGREYTAVTYNIGFGAYTADFTFFMDGGKESRARSKESVLECVDGTAQTALSFDPDTVKVGHNGEFLLLAKENALATLDFEANLVREWNIENSHYDWLDNDMLYVVSEGDLIVYDFDGLNRRVITHNVSSHFPTVITNDRWLYYFSDDNLVREWLIDR